MNAFITLQDPRFNYSYKGFCSIVCAIIDIALEHYSVYNNLNCCVFESQTLKLFGNIYEDSGDEYDAGSWWLNRFFENRLHHSTYSAHTIANVENLKLKNKVFNSILEIKENKKKVFNQKFIDLGIADKTLGIQIRGTDKKTEIPEPDIDNIIKKIDEYFNLVDIENIFLATDDIKYLNSLKERYGSLLLYDDMIHISSNDFPLHNLPNRDIINEEVLSSVFILSRCNHFLYSFSNVSLLALIMGANHHHTILNLNQ
jgi:hypothetical protein